MGLYPKTKQDNGKTTSVLKSQRVANKPIDVRRGLPGNVIIIHGVNDVGTSFAAIEEGLCEGLANRLNRTFKPATYRMPVAEDKDKVEPDPDAVFFKRNVDASTDSPVIPFYWGYREADGHTKDKNGQKTDCNGNRLDKDFSKGGGPFANATSSLPDMWNKGFGTAANFSDDAIRPLLDCPGRLYMVLAAMRLAALISMIRDYDEGETVSIIAHSQGCLVTLLAQAILAEKGLRPADTLILTHPPYSLVDTFSSVSELASHMIGESDAVMAPHYKTIGGMQTLHARLQTLANIVRRVTERTPVPTEPAFASLADHTVHDGIVGGLWKAETDRDNRRKVYLYFCPKDMTVALDNMQGIGWQGVPEFISGTQWVMVEETIRIRGGLTKMTGRQNLQPKTVTRSPLEELGKRFYQRVFTDRQRVAPATRKLGPVLVGAPAPHDYALRLKGEDDHAHVEDSGRMLRDHLPVATWPIDPHDKPQEQRNGIRVINGEALRTPVAAVLGGAGEVAPDRLPPASPQAQKKPKDRGPCEEVDPIDAAIAITSSGGMRIWLEDHPNPPPALAAAAGNITPAPKSLSTDERKALTEQYNAKRNLTGGDQRTVLSTTYQGGKLKISVQESPNEARRRWQHELSAKSFHGSIIGNKENHRQVTAYDVAIGGGTAASDPDFYLYLCDVADWRLKKPKKLEAKRAGILTWENFQEQHEKLWHVERPWRKKLIEDNANYYSTGELPSSLPLPGGKLFEIIVAETISGNRVEPNKRSPS